MEKYFFYYLFPNLILDVDNNNYTEIDLCALILPPKHLERAITKIYKVRQLKPRGPSSMDVFARTIFILKCIIARKGKILRKEEIVFEKRFGIHLCILVTGICYFIKREISHLDAMPLSSMQMTPLQYLETLCNSFILSPFPTPPRNTVQWLKEMFV